MDGVAPHLITATINARASALPAGRGDVGSIITESIFNEMLKHRNDGRCESKGFYSYGAFISAARSFSGFGTTGDDETRKRELAAFLAQTSHETTGGGGWVSVPGYCFIREINKLPYCDTPSEWPCATGQLYYGRGPIQLNHNYNYGSAGRAKEINQDLINNPDLVATDPLVSFKTAIWFWMTPQANKPSSHSVIIGQWTPSDQDIAAKSVPGYGVITNIINVIECGHGLDDRVASRIEFYKRYCGILGLSHGDNLDCYNQMSFSD